MLRVVATRSPNILCPSADAVNDHVRSWLDFDKAANREHDIRASVTRIEGCSPYGIAMKTPIHAIMARISETRKTIWFGAFKVGMFHLFIKLVWPPGVGRQRLSGRMA